MIIARSSLIERIDWANPSLLHVVSPAGYGKTELLRQVAHKTASIFANTADEPAAVWRAVAPGAFLIVDDPAATLGTEQAGAYVEALWRHREPEKKLAIASREPLSIAKTLSPHEALLLSVSDMRFSRSEIERVFEAHDLNDDLLGRIYDYSMGWPVVVLTLERIARERMLSSFFNDEHAALTVPLHRFFSEQVFEPLSTERRRTLVAIDELVELRSFEALERGPIDRGSIEDLEDLGFIGRTTDGYAIAPAFHEYLERREPSIRRILLRELAARLQNAGDNLGAAGAYADAHEYMKAMDALVELLDVGRYDSERFHDVAARIPFQILCRNRRLWWATLADDHEESVVSLSEKASLVGNQTFSNTLRLSAAILAMRDGAFTAARRCLDAVEPHATNEEPRFRALINVLRAKVEAFNGDIAEAERYWEAACKLYPDSPTLFAKKRLRMLTHLLVRKNLLAEHWKEVLDVYDVVHAHADPATTALCAHIIGLTGVAMDVSCASEFAIAELRSIARVSPRAALPFLYLYERGVKPTRTHGRRLGAGNSMVAAIIHAKAANAPAARREVAEALRYLAGLESPNLYTLIVNLSDRIERILQKANVGETSAIETPRGTSLDMPAQLRVLSGTYVSSSREVTLPERSVQLIAYLCTRQQHVSRDELADALWPDLEHKSQLNALKSCVHRTRSLLGDESGRIASTRDGYDIQGIALDVLEAERLIQSADENAMDDDLLLAARRLGDGLPSHMLHVEAFSNLARRLERASERAWTRLGYAAILHDSAEHLQLAVDGLFRIDETNEDAHALLIRWHLARGARDDARRVYENYRSLISRNLAFGHEVVDMAIGAG